MDHNMKSFLSFERWVKNNEIDDDFRLIAWEAWQAAWQAALASKWQPIETAPKGVDILISRDFGKPPVVAGYFEETKEWLTFDEPFTPLNGLRFWQPLPPEPAK